MNEFYYLGLVLEIGIIGVFHIGNLGFSIIVYGIKEMVVGVCIVNAILGREKFSV